MLSQNELYGTMRHVGPKNVNLGMNICFLILNMYYNMLRLTSIRSKFNGKDDGIRESS